VERGAPCVRVDPVNISFVFQEPFNHFRLTVFGCDVENGLLILVSGIRFDLWKNSTLKIGIESYLCCFERIIVKVLTQAKLVKAFVFKVDGGRPRFGHHLRNHKL